MDEQQTHKAETDQVLDNAVVDATAVEHSLTVREAMQRWPWAVVWSIVVSSCIVMEGFSQAMVPSLFANLAFRRRYGERLNDGSYQIEASWQTVLGFAAELGGVLGLLIVGIMADRFGYRKTISASLVMVTGCIFISFFAPNIETLFIGQLLIGLPFGVFQTITIAYASELAPTALRPYLTTYVNLCWVFGQLLSSGVIRATSDRFDEWSYRIPFAVQWVWPVPILIGIYAAPESPWWLVRKGRLVDARRNIERLMSKRPERMVNADDHLALLIHTDGLEKAVRLEADKDHTTYMDCFRGTDRRRTEIVCVTWVIQVVSGTALPAYSAYFLEAAGLDSSNAFSFTMGLYGLGAIGTGLSWVSMSRFGRRTLYLVGTSILAPTMLLIGIIGATVKGNAQGWIVGSLLVAWTFFYDSTLGPVAYSLVSEIPSTRLRAKSLVLARVSYCIMDIVFLVLTPYMLNPSAWNWGAKSAFLFAGSGLLGLVWIYFRLPEPNGRTYGELDVLFERGVSARKFEKAVIDVQEMAIPMDEADKTVKAEVAQIETV